jgi:hypothetical protein
MRRNFRGWLDRLDAKTSRHARQLIARKGTPGDHGQFPGRVTQVGPPLAEMTSNDACRPGALDPSLVCKAHFSRIAYAEILPDEKGPTCAAFMDRARAWFARQGITIKGLLTDSGTGYRSHRFREACQRARIHHQRARPNAPEPTARRSASFRPCFDSRPTEGAIAAPPSAPGPWRAGFAITTRTDPKLASTTSHPSADGRLAVNNVCRNHT